MSGKTHLTHTENAILSPSTNTHARRTGFCNGFPEKQADFTGRLHTYLGWWLMIPHTHTFLNTFIPCGWHQRPWWRGGLWSICTIWWTKEEGEEGGKMFKEAEGEQERGGGRRERLTWVRYVVPVRCVKLVVGFQDLFKQLGVVFIVERRVTTQPADKRFTQSASHAVIHSFIVFIRLV